MHFSSSLKALLLLGAFQYVDSTVIPTREDSSAAISSGQTYTDFPWEGSFVRIYDPPAELSTPSTQSVQRDLVKRDTYCNSTTYENYYYVGSYPAPTALSRDCQRLSEYIRSDPANNTFASGVLSWVRWAEFRTCAFSAKSSFEFGVWVGNEDSANFIRDSVDKFTQKRNVAAGGDATCATRLTNNPVKYATIRWAIHYAWKLPDEI